MSDLRELIKEWRDYASQYDSSQTDTFNARCETWETAAEQLEQALDETEKRTNARVIDPEGEFGVTD